MNRLKARLNRLDNLPASSVAIAECLQHFNKVGTWPEHAPENALKVAKGLAATLALMAEADFGEPITPLEAVRWDARSGNSAGLIHGRDAE